MVPIGGLSEYAKSGLPTAVKGIEKIVGFHNHFLGSRGDPGKVPRGNISELRNSPSTLDNPRTL